MDTRDVINKYLPVLLRAIVVVALALPAFAKFFAYGEQVEAFAGWGLPAPEVMVPVVGVFEVAGLLAVLLGAAARIAALPLIVIMVVALAAAGITVPALAVLLGSLGIAALGSGAFSLWTPEDQLPLFGQRTS
jgi:putative oxidoreductase